MPPPPRNQGHLDTQRNLVAGLKNAFEDPNHLANRKSSALTLFEPVAAQRSTRNETTPPSLLPSTQLDVQASHIHKEFGSNVDAHSTVTNVRLTGIGTSEQIVFNVNMNANGAKQGPPPKPKPKPKPRPILQPPKRPDKVPGTGKVPGTDKVHVKPPPIKPKPTNIPLSQSPKEYRVESAKENISHASQNNVSSSEEVKPKKPSLQRQPNVQSRSPRKDPSSRPPLPYKPGFLKRASQEKNSEQVSTNHFSFSTESDISIESEHENSRSVSELSSSFDNSPSVSVYVKSVPTRTEEEDILEKQLSREKSIADRKRRNLEAVNQYHDILHLLRKPGENELRTRLEGISSSQVSQEAGKTTREKDNKKKNKLPQRTIPTDEKANSKTKLNLKDLGKNVRKNFQKRFSDDEVLSGDELEKEKSDKESQISGSKGDISSGSSSVVKQRYEDPSAHVNDESGAKKKNKIIIPHKLKKFKRNFQKKFSGDELQPDSVAEALHNEDVGNGDDFYDPEIDDDDDYFSDLEGKEAPSEDDLEEARNEASHSVKPLFNKNTVTDISQTDRLSSITTETNSDRANSGIFDAKASSQSATDSTRQNTTNRAPYDSVICNKTRISRSFEKLDEGIYQECQDEMFPGSHGLNEDPQVRRVDNFESYDKFIGGAETGVGMKQDNDSDSEGSADYEEVPDEDEMNSFQADTKSDDLKREAHVPPVWDQRYSAEVVVTDNNGTQQETTEDDEMSGEGIYQCAWTDDAPDIMEHVYDETPATAVAKKYKYTPVNKVQATDEDTGQPKPAFALSDDVAEELEARTGGLSLDQRGREDEGDEDAASVDSYDSGGVAHSEEDVFVSNRSQSSSGRYTQDGDRGAIFSFSSFPSEMVESPDGSSDFDGLSPDFMTRGPKLPSPMAPIPAKRTNVKPSSQLPGYDSGVTDNEAGVAMSGLERRVSGSSVPFYQVYDEGIKRKESLLLIGPKGLAKRRQIIQDTLAKQEGAAEGIGGSSEGSTASQHSENQGLMQDYYDRWYMEEEYGLIVDGKEVKESIYEPLDYEDYLELKRKKLFPLWRDQDVIKDSGLLQQLSTQEQELQEALYEIITSEESYLKSLNLVVTHFMESPELTECLQRQERHTLFSNIATVRNVSQAFFDDLVTYHGDTLLLDDVPNIMLSHMSAMDCYVHYCANNQHQVSLMEQLNKKPHCKTVIQTLEKHPDCQLLDLMSFLILPFQRITRLPLLVKAVLDRAQGEVAGTADDAWQAVTELAQRCNNEARRMEQIKVLHQIATSLVYKDGVKHLELSQKAVLKKKGVISRLVSDVAKFGKKKMAIKQRTLVVTSEKVILAKERVKGDLKRLEVQDWCMSNRVYVEEISEDNKKEMFPSGLPSEAVCVVMITFLENNQKCKAEYILCTPSESEKERWLQVLSTSSTGEMGEKIYDEYDCPEVVCISPYHPRDMDELKLELSDRIDVLTKIDDGWWQGRRLRDGATGWFPQSHVQEIENEHVRARRLKELHMRRRMSKEEFMLGSLNPVTISKYH